MVGNVAETADSEVGFVLRSSVDPATSLSQVDYVKIIVGFSPIDPGIESGEPELSATTTTTTTVPGDG